MKECASPGLEIWGIGTTTPAATLDVSGTYKLGTAGTVLTNMIKTSVAINDATTFKLCVYGAGDHNCDRGNR